MDFFQLWEVVVRYLHILQVIVTNVKELKVSKVESGQIINNRWVAKSGEIQNNEPAESR